MGRKDLKQLSAVSLFTGAGGMDIGVAQAGLEILACVESDPNCCETLRANIAASGQRTHVIEEDVRTVEPEVLRKELGLKAGDLGLLFGGPPCQSFSQIGKQLGLNDERGLLIFQMSRFAEAFQPKAILIENVKGLLTSAGKKGERGEVFEHLLADLERLDYVPKWKVRVKPILS